MSEMIERCAKAIYEKRNGSGCKPWSLQTKTHKAPYLDDAKAAVTELLFPSSEMVEAGDEGCGEYGCGSIRILDIFNRMITAALKEHEGEITAILTN